MSMLAASAVATSATSVSEGCVARDRCARGRVPRKPGAWSVGEGVEADGDSARLRFRCHSSTPAPAPPRPAWAPRQQTPTLAPRRQPRRATPRGQLASATDSTSLSRRRRISIQMSSPPRAATTVKWSVPRDGRRCSTAPNSARADCASPDRSCPSMPTMAPRFSPCVRQVDGLRARHHNGLFAHMHHERIAVGAHHRRQEGVD